MVEKKNDNDDDDDNSYNSNNKLSTNEPPVERLRDVGPSISELFMVLKYFSVFGCCPGIFADVGV